MLLRVEAIVREEKYEDVKSALDAIEVKGFTVSQVMGCGTQKGFLEKVRGSEFDVQMQPKIKFDIVVSDEIWARRTMKAIQEAARTDEIGDGKIFVSEIKEVMRIRTGETGSQAINEEFRVISAGAENVVEQVG